MNKIVVRLMGGIGNQLFSYAAARRLSFVNNAELIIDDVSGFSYDYLYQRSYQLCHFHIPCRQATALERLEPFSRLRRRIKRIVNSRLDLEHRNYIWQERDYEPKLLTFKPKGTVYIQGYWQSENYFADIETIIREDLKITPPQDEQNINLAIRIKKESAVAIHVRYFDKPNETNEKSIYNLDKDYYSRAIDKMEALVPNAHYFVFTEYPAAARLKIPLANEKVTYVSHNSDVADAYADLWLMTQCKHFIIANSTFSWWGAWLAESLNKKVIAPSVVIQEGKMAWGFEGLLPDSWLKL